VISAGLSQAWRLLGGQTPPRLDAAALRAWSQPDWIKVAMESRFESIPAGTLLSTETRILATDPGLDDPSPPTGSSSVQAAAQSAVRYSQLSRAAQNCRAAKTSTAQPPVPYRPAQRLFETGPYTHARTKIQMQVRDWPTESPS
jgi:hypothetical protein